MPSIIRRRAKQRKLDDGAKGVKYFLDGCVMSLGNGGEREGGLACFCNVYNSGQEKPRLVLGCK